MKTDWNSVWLKVRVAPFDWFRFYARWFRHAESAFLRIGPIEFSMCWGFEEACEGCPLPNVIQKADDND